jgi:hypothetical protein
MLTPTPDCEHTLEIQGFRFYLAHSIPIPIQTTHRRSDGQRASFFPWISAEPERRPPPPPRTHGGGRRITGASHVRFPGLPNLCIATYRRKIGTTGRRNRSSSPEHVAQRVPSAADSHHGGCRWGKSHRTANTSAPESSTDWFSPIGAVEAPDAHTRIGSEANRTHDVCGPRLLSLCAIAPWRMDLQGEAGHLLLCYFSIRTTTAVNAGPIEEKGETRCMAI